MRLAYSLVYRFVWDSISGYTFANLKLATITLTLTFSRSPKPSVKNFWSCRLTGHSFTQPLENEPITRMRKRRLPMKTRQTNSETKHQTIRSRICKSTPGRISFELFRQCSLGRSVHDISNQSYCFGVLVIRRSLGGNKRISFVFALKRNISPRA